MGQLNEKLPVATDVKLSKNTLLLFCLQQIPSIYKGLKIFLQKEQNIKEIGTLGQLYELAVTSYGQVFNSLKLCFQ